MSLVPLSGVHILVDPEGETQDENKQQAYPGNELVSWLVGKAQAWEQHRNDGYGVLWRKYWRLWRGFWSEEDKNRMSERSRLIAPALSQAIEMTASEIEEGLFSKEVWFDVADDLADQEKKDAILARDFLLEDIDNVNGKQAIGEAVLLGAIFGTSILKINTDLVEDRALSRTAEGALQSTTDKKAVVFWEAIRPDEFIPDPAGTKINEMLGCFHRVKKPKHVILEKIASGTYRKDALAMLGNKSQDGKRSEIDPDDPQANIDLTDTNEVDVLEYHGKVPLRMFNAIESGEQSPLPVDAIIDSAEDSEMIEVIITVGNECALLRAMINPFVMQDRSIIACQFETVPGRFWGRGTAEKGYNPQVGLDAEIRARADSLGYLSSPMVGVDAGRVPRGFKMEIRPGKVWLTQGPPDEIIRPLMIGQLEPNTFNQSQELERMVQMGTGAFDTAAMLRGQGGQSNGPSASNVSMAMGAFVKRAKRSIRNINNNLVTPLLRQTLWRYMQFSPRRYPSDYQFRVMATLGMVAREVEAMQLTQVIGMMPEQFPQVSVEIAKGIIDLSSLHNKNSVMQAIDQATAPPPPEAKQRQKALEDLQFQAVQAETENKILTNQKTLAETRKLVAEAMAVAKEAAKTDADVMIEVKRLQAELEQIDLAREENRIEWARVQVERERVRKEGASSKP